MDNFKVIKYSYAFYNEWNDFVKNSKNGTFLFYRDFMEYHKDRFQDFSLLVFKNEKLIAVLPANKIGQEVYSHQGLTYGGLLLPKNIKFDIVINIFNKILCYLNIQGFESLILKQVPSIYNAYFTEEVLYLMFILKAKLLKRDTLSVIDLHNKKLEISNNRIEGFNRGKKNHLVVKEENNFEIFWNHILITNLKNKHNAKPVHSLDEINFLKSKFPKSIRQFNVYNDDKIVAGTTIFESQYVAHSQYISADENKNILGSLDFLHVSLVNEIFKNKRYFDFGISNKNHGMQIDKGLQFWKEGFGARTLTQDHYKVKTKNFDLLNNVLI